VTRHLVLRAACAFALAGWTLPAAAVPPSTVRVEIDYMVDATHSHRPTDAEIAAVTQMFACHGITLIVEFGAIPHVNTMVDGPAANDFFTATGPNTFGSMKSAYRNHTTGGWHYCICGHDYTADGSAIGSSGLGETGGDDFVVTLGSFAGGIGTPFDRAGTFAHELGHNLGLTHEAGQSLTVGTHKPIYASIMSYAFQLRGVRTALTCFEIADAYSLFKELDYSNGRLPSVDENALNELLGARIRKVDWNCNGVYSGVLAHDLEDGNNNGTWCDDGGPREVLSDYNDWANIQDNTSAYQPESMPYSVCITAEEFAKQEMQKVQGPSSCPAPQPAVAVESCQSAVMAWVQSGYSGTQTGTGNQPFNTFLGGYNSVPSGSVLYMQPGTYTGVGTGVLSKPLVIAGPGVAEIRP
jgi:hypothetical protein